MQNKGQLFRYRGVLAVLVVLVVAGALFFLAHPLEIKNGSAPAQETLLVETQTPEEVLGPGALPEDIPGEFLLDVPFTSQAPFGDWGMPYQEACEETAALVVHYYYQGKKFTPEIANREILAIVDFENSFLGFYKDTDAEQTAEWIKAYWGYDRVDVIVDPTPDDLKRNIAAGRPVIVPAAGRQLRNPNFTPPGPIYHMLVVRGYTAETFVTNDVGTRKGEKYTYRIETVMKAMHDWNGGDIEHGAKKIIVIWPPQ